MGTRLHNVMEMVAYSDIPSMNGWQSKATKRRDAWLDLVSFHAAALPVLSVHNNHAKSKRGIKQQAAIMAGPRRVLGLMVLSIVLLLATLVSTSSSSSSASSTGLNSSVEAITDRDEEIAEVLTQLEEQVEIALDKLGSSATEIDIEVIFEDDSGSRGPLPPIADDSGGDDEEERFSGDEWVVIVPRTSTAPVAGLPFDDDLEANQDAIELAQPQLDSANEAVPHVHRRPEWQEQQEQQDVTNWAELFAPNGWGPMDSYRQFDQRQLLGPANLAVLTAMTSVAMLLVLGVWSLSRRSQRRRAAERQSQWAASVELLDAMPYYGNSIV